MKKRSKQKSLIDRADRELQDAYRRRFKGKLCESCGLKEFYCVHHHSPKSRSNAGRYHKKNLIFICKLCHDEISFNGGSQVIARYSVKRGKKWVKEMDLLVKERRGAFGKKELKKIISYYQKWKLKERLTQF